MPRFSKPKKKKKKKNKTQKTSLKKHKFLEDNVSSIPSFDDTPQTIVSPEEKAAQTRGLKLTGNITLKQYIQLLDRGYEGHVVMHWTAHHAQKVLDANWHARHSRPALHGLNTKSKSQRIKTKISPGGTITYLCSDCGNPVNINKLDKHHNEKCIANPNSIAVKQRLEQARQRVAQTPLPDDRVLCPYCAVELISSRLQTHFKKCLLYQAAQKQQQKL
jgi:hypothetical protein